MKKPKRKEAHPTLFVLDGSIRYYDDGSMLELHSLVTPEEWIQIVEETIKYKIFVNCLKEVAIPLLEERWDDDDDYFRIQLDVAVSRIRNIDPLLVAKFNQKEIAETYSKQMAENAKNMLKMVETVREDRQQALLKQLEDDNEVARVSDL